MRVSISIWKNAFMIWLYGTSMKRANEKGNFKQSFNM